MPHIPKVGDKFKLGKWEWAVEECAEDDRRFVSYSDGGMRYLVLWKTDADSLDWLEPEITFTREQIKELKITINGAINKSRDVKDWVDRIFDYLDERKSD